MRNLGGEKATEDIIGLIRFQHRFKPNLPIFLQYTVALQMLDTPGVMGSHSLQHPGIDWGLGGLLKGSSVMRIEGGRLFIHFPSYIFLPF